jgi:hypothetical protein
MSETMLSKIDAIESQVLNDRLRDADKRLAKIEIALLNRPADGSYQRQELLSEQSELIALRRATALKLRDLSAPAPPPDERKQRFVEAETRARRQGLEQYIQQLEAAGDHREARLWRRELLNVREQVEREFFK